MFGTLFANVHAAVLVPVRGMDIAGADAIRLGVFTVAVVGELAAPVATNRLVGCQRHLTNPHKPGIALGGELPVSDAPANHMGQHAPEPQTVTHVPVVEPEGLFVQVPLKVEFSDGDVSAANAPFEQAPKVLDATAVLDIAPDVRADASVDHLTKYVSARVHTNGLPFGFGVERHTPDFSRLCRWV